MGQAYAGERGTVLTQIGQAFPGRVAASLLTALELPELVTRSALDYEQRAIALARDAAQLEALRARLATQRLHGRLFDAARFTRHMESAYIEMMRRRRAGQRPEHITIVA